jgi:hypothetical protein
MRQIYFCPNCRALIAAGDRFCGNCGINLNWVVLQPPQSSPVSYDYRCPNQQQRWIQQPRWREQPGRNQPLPYAQAPVCGNPNQYQQRYMYDNRGAIPQKKSSSVNGTITPMRAEIYKLLEEFFGEHIKYNKMQ